MTLEMWVQEIKALPVAERKQLVMVILDSLTAEQEEQPLHNVLEFRGVGAHLRDMDAQEYVNELRREWDDQPD
jgi:predicted NUDIX family phosphoesterase